MGMYHSPLCPLNSWVFSHTIFFASSPHRWRSDRRRDENVPPRRVCFFLGSHHYLEITRCFLCSLQRLREAQAGKLKTKLPAGSFPFHTVRAQAEGVEGLFVVFSFPAQQAHWHYCSLETMSDAGCSIWEWNSLNLYTNLKIKTSSQQGGFCINQHRVAKSGSVGMNLLGRKNGDEEILETKTGKDVERPGSLFTIYIFFFWALLHCRPSHIQRCSSGKAGYPLLAIFKDEC